MDHILNRCKGIRDQNQIYISDSLLFFFRNHEKDFEKPEPEDAKIRWLKQHGLSLMDGWHILAYTGTASGWLNDHGREGNENKCPCVDVFSHGLDQCLEKLTPYQGTTYRMERCDEKGMKSEWFHNNIGKTFLLPYFLSTGAFDYNNSPMVWIIQTCANSNARNIDEISNAPGEREILFRKNSVFKITGVNLDDPEKALIYLQELPVPSKTTIHLTGLYYRNL